MRSCVDSRSVSGHRVLNLAVFLLLAAVGACKKKSSSSAPDPNDPEALFRRGKSIYLSNCIACHNSDPKKKGNIGPEVAGASLELLRAKILKGNYPEGYAPKRKSTLMPVQPQLEKDLPGIAEFLKRKAG